MALTDEELKALGLDMPPPDVAMQPGPLPAVIAQPAPVRYPSSILGDKIPPGAPIPQSHEEGKQEFQQYMPKITADPGTTDYFRQRQEQLNYKAEHPWGAPISAHPGVLGSILHGLSVAGNIAGDVIDPAAMSLIPGTQLHNAALARGNEAGIRQGEENEEKEAQTGLANATTEKTQAETDALNNPQPKIGATPEEQTIHDLMAGNNGAPQINPATKKPYSYLEAYMAVQQAREGAKPQKPAPGETQEQNKLGFQAIVSKIDAAGLPTGVKSLDSSLDKALKRGAITPQEHAAARSYLAANPTPGTNLEVHVAGNEQAQQAAINKMFEGKEVLAHLPDGRRMQMPYAEAQAQGIPAERLVALNANEAQQNRDKAASVQTTFQGLDRYRSDFKANADKLTPADRDALRVLTAHNESGQTGGILAGFVDDIPLAGPLSSYANKLLQGTMTSDQYNHMSPAGKKLVSDYATAIIDNFANMKAIMGTVGRNPQMIQAEVNTLPAPYLDWESAAIQFENKRAALAGRAGSMPEIYTPPQK